MHEPPATVGYIVTITRAQTAIFARDSPSSDSSHASLTLKNSRQIRSNEARLRHPIWSVVEPAQNGTEPAITIRPRLRIVALAINMAEVREMLREPQAISNIYTRVAEA